MVWYILGGLGLILLLAGTAASNSASVTGYRSLIRAVSGMDIPGYARQIKEGYFLSGMFDERHVPVIQRQGIKAVISAEILTRVTQEALQAAGIEWVPVMMGASFLHADRIYDVLQRYEPQEILMQCSAGMRTGNIAAFALVVHDGWDIDDALYALVNPAPVDIDGLGVVLAQWGDYAPRNPGDAGVGMYSLSAIGKAGGMGARDDAARAFISTNIEAMRSFTSRVCP